MTIDKIIGSAILGVLGITFVLGIIVPPDGNATKAKPTAAVIETDAGVSLAGTFVVFVKNCPDEFDAMTPQYQDAVTVFVQDEIAKHGADVIKEAAADDYQSHYYTLGKKWCSIGNSAAKSVARSMTR